jgi:hypothetical protein
MFVKSYGQKKQESCKSSQIYQSSEENSHSQKADVKKSAGSSGILFRHYDNNIAFTVIVSCAAYAFFLAVTFVMRNTESLIAQQEQQIAAMNYSVMGQVAGVQTDAEKE